VEADDVFTTPLAQQAPLLIGGGERVQTTKDYSTPHRRRGECRPPKIIPLLIGGGEECRPPKIIPLLIVGGERVQTTIIPLLQ
jgi:hypothetical protein